MKWVINWGMKQEKGDLKEITQLLKYIKIYIYSLINKSEQVVDKNRLCLHD
jgi:hypothetical protein